MGARVFLMQGYDMDIKQVGDDIVNSDYWRSIVYIFPLGIGYPNFVKLTLYQLQIYIHNQWKVNKYQNIVCCDSIEIKVVIVQILFKDQIVDRYLLGLLNKMVLFVAIQYN
eukprot:TRINITY_DN4751_c0_g1_i3.p1 TRINITY_DN4751_c0_g1~~TRINITY_DN4751_c0_g1_i3.p1  ORF type:complete len:111 (-),score=3.16 TRINITY_DN4751_c0_g1_i3:134-466(-)